MTLEPEGLSTLQLFPLSAAIGTELRKRRIVRTANLAGCYAERLFSEAFGWTLERNSKSGYDAIDQGVRYQIKCRRPTSQNKSRQLGEFSKFSERRFDKLAAIIFNEDYSIKRAVIMDYDDVARLSKVVLERQRLVLDDWICGEPTVLDVTTEVSDAQARL